MASAAAQPETKDLEKKAAAGEEEEEENPEEAMDDEDDEEEDGGDGEDGDLEEDVAVEIGATYSCKRPDGSYLNRRQNEWVDKTRLVIPKPVKDGQVANSAGPEMAENGNTALKRKNDDGTSEAKRVKVDVEIAPTASGVFREVLTCLLCSELFKDPVMVECGHNFCRNCTDKTWSGQESFTCPDCKEVITDKRYTTNRALANLVKKTVGAKKPKPSENCPQHEERLKLYCKDDGTLSCIICRDYLIHANHNFLPILDAVGVYRAELSAIVAPLEEALKVTEQLTTQQSEKVEQHKINVSESRKHIVSEFETLGTFLKEKEEKLLERLEEQGKNIMKEIETSMEKLQENQENIKETIAMANERMNDTDSKSFLTGIKLFLEKCQEQQNAVMVAGNKRFSKDLCQGTFKGPIQYFIWKDMKSFVVPAKAAVRKELSTHQRDLIVERYQSGEGYKKISKALQVPWNTVKTVIKKWIKFGTTVTLPRTGRSSKIDENTRRKLLGEAAKRPTATLKELQEFLASTGCVLHVTTISRILHMSRLLG